MGEFQGDLAVQLPSLAPPPGETMMFLKQLGERRKMQEQARAAAAAQHDEMNQMRDVNMQQELFNRKNFLVGQTQVDNHINDKLTEIQDQASKLPASIQPAVKYAMISQALGPVVKLSSAAKNTMKSVDNEVAMLKAQHPDIDIAKLKSMALHNALLVDEPNGGLSYNPNPDDSKQHASDLLQNRPDEFVNSDAPVKKLATSFKLMDDGSDKTVEHAGVTNQYKWSAKLSPFSEVVRDKNGKPTGAAIKKETVDLGDGKTMDVLPEKEYEILNGDPNAKLVLNAKVNQFIKQHNLPIDRNSHEAEILKRKIARDMLGGYNLHSFVDMSKRTESTPYERGLAGYPEFGKAGGSGDGEAKQGWMDKNPLAITTRAILNDNSILSGQPIVKMDGEPMHDLSTMLSGLKMGGAINGVNGDSKTPLGIYKSALGKEGIVMKFNDAKDAVPYIGYEAGRKGKDGNYNVHLTNAEFAKFIKNTGLINGLNLKQIDELTGKLVGAAPKKQNILQRGASYIKGRLGK